MKRKAKTRKAEDINQTTEQKQMAAIYPAPLTTIETGRIPVIEDDDTFNNELASIEELHNLDKSVNTSSRNVPLRTKNPATKLAEVIPLPATQPKALPVPLEKPHIKELKKQIEQLSDPGEVRVVLSCSRKKAFDVLGYVPRVEEHKISYHQKQIAGHFYWYASWKEGGEKKEKYIGPELPTDIDTSQVSTSYHPNNPSRPSSARLRSSKARTR